MFQIYYTVRRREMSRKRTALRTVPFSVGAPRGRPLQDDVISISHSVYWEKHPNSERGAHVRPLQCHYPLTRLLFKDVLGQAHGFIAEEAFIHGLQIFGDVRYEFHLVEDVLLQIHARCDFRED